MWLEKNTDSILNKKMEKLIYAIKKSCQIKMYFVSKDVKESSMRMILNFGHTIGHGIEAATAYGTYSHGEAVAIGMKAATELAILTGHLAAQVGNRLIGLLERLGFSLHVPELSVDTILDKMGTDKKIKGGRFRFILPTDIGSVTIVDDVPMPLIRDVISNLKEAV